MTEQADPAEIVGDAVADECDRAESRDEAAAECQKGRTPRRTGTDCEHDDETNDGGDQAGARDGQHERHRPEREHREFVARRTVAQCVRRDHRERDSEKPRELIRAFERPRHARYGVIVKPDSRGCPEPFLRDRKDAHNAEDERQSDADGMLVRVGVERDGDRHEDEHVLECLERFAQRGPMVGGVRDRQSGGCRDGKRATEQQCYRRPAQYGGVAAAGEQAERVRQQHDFRAG